MTKITNRALNRKFERGDLGQGVRRGETLEPEKGSSIECAVCFKPIFLSAGQIIKRDKDGGFSHKACRGKDIYYGK